jgi:hypothetical protein
MIRQFVIGGVALLASAGLALAQTEVVSGDQGFDRQELGGAELYDATEATVLVEQGRNNTGYNIVRSPAPAMFLGGRTLGRGSNRTTPWRSLYDQGNGACVRFESSPNLTVRRHYGEFCWDGLKPVTGSRNWTVEDSWLRHIRDDAIEADHAGAHDGVVRRTFFEGVHTFLSVTPGDGEAIHGHVRVEFHDNLMSLGCGLDDGKPCEDRSKRLQYAWSRPDGSGQAFKVRGCGDDVDILFRGNIVMMETGINTAGANLPIFQCMRVLPGSTGNTFYWLGACNFRGLEMTSLHGACVPKQFQLDPAVWTHASNDRAAWEAEVARWQAEIWDRETTPPDPDPDEPTEPDPDETSEPGPTESGPPAGETLVAVDVRPEQCPNRVRTNKDRTFPVVIVGTDSFDVRDVNPESIRLAGVPPKHDRTRYRDRASPYEPVTGKDDAHDCGREGGDGIEDLLLRFSSKSLGKALGPVPDRAEVVVPLTGKLKDGTPIHGEEVIVVLN